MMRKTFPAILLLFAAVVAIAGPPPAQLRGKIDGILTAMRRDKKMRIANVGIKIQSLTDGTVWYTHNGKNRFIPASTAKTVTAAMALEYLTPDYRFMTRLSTDGEIKEGVLHGNLIVQGGGDPSLLPDDLCTLAQQLAAGDPAQNRPPITQVTGSLILDESCFPRCGPQLGYAWERGDLPWYYAAPTSALSCNRNAVQVLVRGTTHGAPPEVVLTPETKLFTIVNKAVTSSNVKTGAISVSPQGSRVVITGRIAPGAELSEDISVSHPEKLLAEQLAKALAIQGISLLKQPQACDPAMRNLLVEHASASLPEIITTMLKESDNHTAEQLRWTLLSRIHQDTVLRERYKGILKDYARLIGVSEQSMVLVDGSGLSRASLFSPDSATRLLTYLAASPHFTAFYDALPIAGVDGTLKKRMIGTQAAGNARAKTGTMRGVSCLTGYVTTTSGERLVFAIMLNRYSSGATTARNVQDSIVSYLAGL